MRKKSLLIMAVLTLVFASLTYFVTSHNYDNKIEKLNDSVKFKQNEILELKRENESLKLKVKNKSDNLEELELKINTIKDDFNNLKDKNEKLKNELNKYESLRNLNVVATAYTAFCNTGCTGVTATGYDVSNTIYKNGRRVVAVDPRVIPLGSLIHVKSGNMNFIGVAEDTGGAIKGNKIDILVKNKSIAFNFGRQSASVTIIREGRG